MKINDNDWYFWPVLKAENTKRQVILIFTKCPKCLLLIRSEKNDDYLQLSSGCSTSRLRFVKHVVLRQWNLLVTKEVYTQQSAEWRCCILREKKVHRNIRNQKMSWTHREIYTTGGLTVSSDLTLTIPIMYIKLTSCVRRLFLVSDISYLTTD